MSYFFVWSPTTTVSQLTGTTFVLTPSSFASCGTTSSTPGPRNLPLASWKPCGANGATAVRISPFLQIAATVGLCAADGTVKPWTLPPAPHVAVDPAVAADVTATAASAATAIVTRLAHVFGRFTCSPFRAW